MPTCYNQPAAAAKSLQSCPTLCDPRDGSQPGSPIPGILQARTLEWVAISFSNAWKWKERVKSLSCVRPSATPWTAAFQAPPSTGFSRQEYWSGMPLPSPRHHLKKRQIGLQLYFPQSTDNTKKSHVLQRRRINGFVGTKKGLHIRQSKASISGNLLKSFA